LAAGNQVNPLFAGGVAAFSGESTRAANLPQQGQTVSGIARDSPEFGTSIERRHWGQVTSISSSVRGVC